MPLFPEISQGEKVATMGLDRSYKFLKAKGEKKANNYLENKKLQGLLSKRNSSILAHGLLPVEKKTYTDLREQVLKLASEFYPGIDEFLAKASFPKIEVTL